MLTLKRDALGSYTAMNDPGEPQHLGVGGRRVSVTEHEAAILSAGLWGRIVIEVGTGLGVSTLAISATAHRVFTIDPDPWVVANVWPMLESKRDNVVLSSGVADYFPWRRGCDGAFIDGDHRFAAVLLDCKRVLACLAGGCPVYMHDYFGEVEKAAVESGLRLVHRFDTPHKLALCETPRI